MVWPGEIRSLPFMQLGVEEVRYPLHQFRASRDDGSTGGCQTVAGILHRHEGGRHAGSLQLVVKLLQLAG